MLSLHVVAPRVGRPAIPPAARPLALPLKIQKVFAYPLIILVLVPDIIHDVRAGVCLAGCAVLVRAGPRGSGGWRCCLQVLLVLLHAPVTAVRLTLVSIPAIILQQKNMFENFLKNTKVNYFFE